MIAFIVAVEYISIRGCGEKGETIAPNVHRHGLDVSPYLSRQTILQDIPAPPPIAASGYPSVSGVGCTPAAWDSPGPRHKQEFLLARVQEKGIGIADPEIPGREILP